MIEGTIQMEEEREVIEQLKTEELFTFHKGWGMNSSIYNGKQLSIIIPAQNEEATIKEVILEARKIEPKEIIVVINGQQINRSNC